ncbi:MAG: hypothetical protein QOJ06_1799 [Pseudonocardiales bacterium]|jgi:hypothetical protein|nr:hypothetical protein [Mycobacterium sp.]MDT7596253.1 hypothetical protein [Pseudonocardiales bacterium]
MGRAPRPVLRCRHVYEQCQLVHKLLAVAASKPSIAVHDGHRPHMHHRSLDDLVSRV